MPSLLYAIREAEWTEQTRRNSCVIACQGVEATVIRTPDSVQLAMEQSSYVERIETIVDILRADFFTLGLSIHKIFTATVSGTEYSYRYHETLDDDESEPTIRFRAFKLMEDQ